MIDPTQLEISGSEDEGYQLDVSEVANILGVTRTRVSQLTSNGQLSFELRRVGVRNRLFYKRSEVVAYQRTFYGRHVPFHSTSPASEASPRPDHFETLISARAQIDSRLGASSSSGPRAQFALPEQLLLETSKLQSQEQQNSFLLSKIQDTLNIMSARVFQQGRKELPTALERLEEQKIADKLSAISKLINVLSDQLSQQESKIESLFGEIASLKKDIRQIQWFQQRNYQSLSFSMRRLESLPEVATENELAGKNPANARSRISKRRVARAIVKKRISFR